ncbi:MAG: restriction endonuclease subunit S [Lachnospiraceae bacterium]
MNNITDAPLVPITELLEDIIDNRGKSCPTQETGFPLIATNCIKHSSIYPTFENIRYVSDEVLQMWFRAELKSRDILFVNKGTPGRVCLVPDPITFCAAQDMIGLRADSKKVYYKYLFAILRSNYIQEKIKNFHVGIAIPHFKKSDMKNLLIPVPEMGLQIKIGDMYCQLSEKIENNNKICLELESMAKTIYDYWFLQFEFPNEDGKPYKSSGGKMVWNEELKREIPEGWRKGSFADLLEIGNGKDHKELRDGNIPVYGSGGVMRTVDTSIYNGESVLIPRKGTLNNIIYVNGAFWTVDTMFYTKMKKAHSAIFAYYSAKLYDFEKLNTGTGVPSMTSSIIYNLKIVIPTKNVLESFDNYVQALYKQMNEKESENRELVSLRDFLLPLLMNGQVGFRN